MEESETAVQEEGRWLNYEDGRALRGFLTVNYSEIGDVPRVSASRYIGLPSTFTESWRNSRKAIRFNEIESGRASRELLLLITFRHHLLQQLIKIMGKVSKHLLRV